jgi:hypothetical protein
MIRFIAQAYSYPKDPGTPVEWEDSAACSVRMGRFAVADGASAAFRAREWAAQLTKAYITSFPRPAPHPPPVQPADGHRHAEVRDWFTGQVSQWHDVTPRPTRWAARQAEQHQPSSATFAGLCLIPSTPQATRQSAFWEACAIGDSCLFHISDGRLVDTFPMTPGDQFSNHPDLLTVAPERVANSVDKVQIKTGHAFPGDIFLLATDAASAMLFKLYETAPGYLARMGFLGLENFPGMLAELRENEVIEVDDVTVVIVAVVAEKSGKSGTSQ